MTRVQDADGMPELAGLVSGSAACRKIDSAALVISAVPEWIKPQLTKLVDTPPDGPEWLHEIKFDGYRMHARLDRDAVRLLTRTGLDWTHKYLPIAEAVSALGARRAPSLSRRRIVRRGPRHHHIQHHPAKLLDVTRLESGNLQLEPAATDLSQLVLSIVHRYEAEAAHQHCVLEHDIETDAVARSPFDWILVTFTEASETLRQSVRARDDFIRHPTDRRR